MNIFIKALNPCVMRRQTIARYQMYLQANGHCLVSHPETADAIIVWTCGFRSDMATNSTVQVRKLRTRFRIPVYAAGCLPGINDIASPTIPWHHDWAVLPALFGDRQTPYYTTDHILCEPATCIDANSYRTDHPTSHITFADQFTKLLVGEGCTKHCTYCTERLAFPPQRNFPHEKLVAAAEKADPPYMLLADSLADYQDLPKLITDIHTIKPNATFALNNLHPAYVRDHLDELTHLPICHINLPIQSASDPILADMKRDYCYADLTKIATHITCPMDTHIIVGFPGETETDLQRTLNFIIQHHFTYVLVSTFYDTPRIPAHTLQPKIPETVKHQRAQRAVTTLSQAGILCQTPSMVDNLLQRLNS